MNDKQAASLRAARADMRTFLLGHRSICDAGFPRRKLILVASFNKLRDEKETKHFIRRNMKNIHKFELQPQSHYAWAMFCAKHQDKTSTAIRIGRHNTTSNTATTESETDMKTHIKYIDDKILSKRERTMNFFLENCSQNLLADSSAPKTRSNTRLTVSSRSCLK